MTTVNLSAKLLKDDPQCLFRVLWRTSFLGLISKPQKRFLKPDLWPSCEPSKEMLKREGIRGKFQNCKWSGFPSISGVPIIFEKGKREILFICWPTLPISSGPFHSESLAFLFSVYQPTFLFTLSSLWEVTPPTHVLLRDVYAPLCCMINYKGAPVSLSNDWNSFILTRK